MKLQPCLSVYMIQVFTTLCFIVLLDLVAVADGFSLAFRSATPKDVFLARKTMFSEAMNPLAVSQDRLLVAFDDDEDERLLGFGQIRPLSDVYSELASLYVMPENREQGIGGALVQQLLLRHEEQEEATQVCLLTLRPTSGFYEKYGFEVLDEKEMKSSMPSSFQFEYAAGSVVSSLLGNGLVCMVRRT